MWSSEPRTDRTGGDDLDRAIGSTDEHRVDLDGVTPRLDLDEEPRRVSLAANGQWMILGSSPRAIARRASRRSGLK